MTDLTSEETSQLTPRAIVERCAPRIPPPVGIAFLTNTCIADQRIVAGNAVLPARPVVTIDIDAQDLSQQVSAIL